ncbi:MAG: cell division protein FtsH [Firmicutes bacterium]|nr:cell division protein FtsH [Bacillota bacterium]
MEEEKAPKKPLIYYYALAILMIILLNALVFPSLFKQPVTQVDYGTFLKQLTNGAVTKVEIQETQIDFIAKNEAGKDTAYVTGRMDDPGLVNRLYGAGVEFNHVIPQENSPLMNFLLTWILPIGLFFVIGQFLAGQMQKRMGAGMNAMTFGKSNAKVYVKAQTGKT